MAHQLRSASRPFLDFLYPAATRRSASKYAPSQFAKPRGSSSRLIFTHTARLNAASSPESLPRIAQPSMWTSLIPSFLRRPSPGSPRPARPSSKEWNPATFYIVIFLLIGSQAIQMIALRREYSNITRKSEARIGLLREVIERVQKGEDVDVEGLLGSGDKAKEREWEEVLREIEQEDALWRSRAGKTDTSVEDALPEAAQATVSNTIDTETRAKSIEEVSAAEETTKTSETRATKGRREYY